LLAFVALALLARELRRVDRDPLRRPLTLLAGSLVVVVLGGTIGGRALPDPWWLLLPAAVLAWEAARGWRRSPRWHLWESGVGAWAAGLVLAAVALALPAAATAPLLAAAAAACAIGTGLMVRSARREPRSWRRDDPDHYERRESSRPPRGSGG
jgi:hypothetical protein